LQKLKKILPPLAAGIHNLTFNSGDRHYSARPETDLKKNPKENRKRIHGENCHNQCNVAK
jgi:hypothetical protein